MRRNNWMLWLLGCCLLASCGNHIPGDIIQPDQMEDILYDYHIASSMSNNLNTGEYYKKKAYQNYIFQKHDITEAEFDSSMVWYTRHTSELATIYSNLNDRFKKEKQHIDMFLSAREEDGYTSIPGDTVDVWPYRRFYWLSDNPLNNQFVFEITPDSNYHIQDAFLWKANYSFLTKGKVTMALNVLYSNDSVVGQSKLIERSGMDSIYLYTDSAYQIKKINGFIYVPKDSVQKSDVIINELSLIKYHLKVDSISAINDSLKVLDNTPNDSKQAIVNIQPSEKIKVNEKPAPIKLQRKLPTD